jgi:UDP-glucose 4-epimerase
LVTGGAGFIGSHLVDRLVSEGHNVSVIDNLSCGKKEYLNGKAVFHKLDIVRDGKKIRKVIEKFKPTVVFHLAAHKDLRDSIEKPTPDAMENIIGTLNILEPVRDTNKGARFVFASTAAVYSSKNKLPVEEGAFIRPAAPYGVAKRSVEMYLWHFSTMYPIAAVSLRFANIYGPRETFGSGSVITRFVKQAGASQTPTIFGTGEATRDFLYVDDVVEGLMRAMRVGWCGEMNLATNQETSVNEVLGLINRQIDGNIQAKYEDAKEGELFQSRLDATAAKEVMGWEAKVGVEEGIKRTINWCNEVPNECKKNN